MFFAYIDYITQILNLRSDIMYKDINFLEALRQRSQEKYNRTETPRKCIDKPIEKK